MTLISVTTEITREEKPLFCYNKRICHRRVYNAVSLEIRKFQAMLKFSNESQRLLTQSEICVTAELQ